MSKIKEFLLKRLFRIFGLPGDIFYFLRAFISIGHPSYAPTPKVLVIFNLRNIVRGLFTRFIVSSNLDWIWPYWIVRQFYPRNKEFVSRGFQPVSINVAHRNWTGIGALNGDKEATVDQRGLITPFTNGWSLDNWLIVDGKVFSPSAIEKVSQKLYKNLPIIITEYKVDEFLVTTLAFVVENDLDVIYQKVTVKNISRKVKECSLAFAIRPYNAEGLSLIHCIEFPGNNSFYVNDKVGGVFMQTPDEIHWSHLSKGDVSLFLDEPVTAREYVVARSRVGLATALAKYNQVLYPGKSKSFEIRIPLDRYSTRENKKKKIIDKIYNHHFDKMLEQTVAQWEDKLYKGLHISVPDKKVMSAFWANKAFLLLFYDGKEIMPGPSTYHHFWLRDAAYMVHALDLMGYHTEAEKILKTYPGRQKWDGNFFSQSGEWDSSGEAIWTIVEHYKFTKDLSFLKKMFPSIRNAANWIIRKRWRNKNKAPGYKGMIPPGLSAEHFGLSDYYYWDDFWSLAGLRDTLFSAQELKKTTYWWQRNYNEFFKAINKSLKYIEGNFGRPIIPVSPSRRMDSAAVGALVAYYPLKLLNCDDIRLKNTIDYLREKHFIEGGFFHDVNHAGYGTYLTMHIAQCLLGQRKSDALDIFNWFLKVATPTWTWPESINPQTFGGAIGDGHHGWALVEMLIFLRNLLFIEEKGRMIITPVFPKNWIKKGKNISITEAPSEFGKVNFEIKIIDAKRFL
ncbi:MAG: hypothetical protein KKA19_09320, partial [Candidatus Margulisbacteria bacterium]|nr:hypothetical protein [Candidatus Margulisiibacteriota bacterium]